MLYKSPKPDNYYSQSRPEMLEFVPDGAKKVLDVGCGRGLFGQQLKEKLGAEVWGIELDPVAGQEATQKLDKVYVGDILEVVNKLPENFFDCLIFNDILEHLIDPYDLLAKIKRNLNDRGVVVSSIPNVRYISNLKELLFAKQWRYREEGILDKTHLRFFTEKSILDMFDSLDYQVVRIEGINPIKSWKFKLLNIISIGYLKDTGYLQFAVVAKVKK